MLLMLMMMMKLIESRRSPGIHGGDDGDYDSDDLYINYNHPFQMRKMINMILNDQGSNVNMSHHIMEISTHEINTRLKNDVFSLAAGWLNN